MIGCEFKLYDCIVDVMICCICKYFEFVLGMLEIIVIIYGEGYCFCGDLED